MAVTEERALIGTSVPRKEDPELLTGQARYVDNLTVPGMVWAYLVRSPYAHARVRGVDLSAALAAEGVVAAFSGADLKDEWGGPLPMAWPVTEDIKNPPHWPLTPDVARYAGDGVAVVVARDARARERRGRARRGGLRAAARGHGRDGRARGRRSGRPRGARLEPLLHLAAPGR